MADVAIVNRAVISAPKTYTLGANEELALKAVRAVIDGTGAGGSFLPTLQLVAPDETVMWESAPTGSIAAGGSADVSWFPGLGVGGGGGLQALVGARIEAHAAQAVATATATDVVYDTVAFDTDGMANLAGDSRKLTVNTPGLYLVVCETTWDANTAGRRLNGITVNGFISGGAVFQATDSRNAIFTPVASPGHTPNTSVGIFSAVAGDYFASGCLQGSGGNLNCNGLQAGSNQDNFLSAIAIGVL